MPRPVMRENTYYLRVSVPKDVRQSAKGKTIALPVGDAICHVKVGDDVKVSLKTKNPAEAKARHIKALEALMQFWEALRSGPAALTHKQILGLAGEAYHMFVKAADDNPGPPSVWLKALHFNVKADTGVLAPASSLLVLTNEQKAEAVARDRETRFGPFADAILARHSVVTDPASRSKLVEQISYALTDASLINHAKASGDYSNSGETAKYPAFVSAKAATRDTSPSTPTSSRSLDDVISQRVKDRQRGRTAKPIPKKTEDKYRKAAREFEAFRPGQGVETITAREARDWRDAMLEDGKLSNATIAQRIQNVSTVVKWAREQSFGELFPDGNPFDVVPRPDRDTAPSHLKTHSMQEARTILRGARSALKPEIRWLPWICAYSGARIEEVAPLKPSDFFTYENEWYVRITTLGGRSLKNQHSERRVPLHPDLIAEGLIDFVNERRVNPDNRMFPKRSGQNIREWIKDDLKIYREHLRGNHGWRHLFEDKARAAGITDSARETITGRSTSRSSAGYGKSEVMLPGLMQEIRKITSYL